MWYIQISATSLVFSSLLSLPSTVPSPTNSHVLYEVRYVEGINKFHVNHHQQTTTSSLKKISCDVMHLNVSNLPGLLLQVLLAVHGVVDHQLSCTWCVVRHIESKKNLISTTITTAYHILVNENFNWCDTSYCQRPPWSSPPCCPCRPQCRPPPNNMSKK